MEKKVYKILTRNFLGCICSKMEEKGDGIGTDIRDTDIQTDR
jgi:hypothetical protein